MPANFNLDAPEILAEGVTPEAAIKFWRERAKLTWDQARDLADGAKARAFYVTGLYQQDLLELVSDALEAALQNGETLPEFKKRILAAIRSQGWHSHRVENIFRTNMQSAYAAGRYLKMQTVKKSRPYWQYLAIMDRRTRPGHAILHGRVYPADHEFWNANYPANGFRCRCGVATLSQRQVDAQGLEVEKEMPKPGVWTDPKTGMEHFVHFPGADSGFANNPYKDWAKDGGVGGLPGLKTFKGARARKAAPAKPQPVIQTVADNQELGAQLKRHLSRFTRNGPVTSVIFDQEGYFMATTSNGRYWISQRNFPRSGNFNPARDLCNAWNKMATGQKLTFNEEYALESLWHETVHNRQTPTYAGQKGTISLRMMETVTQWVARRSYPKFMAYLGGKPEHQADILTKGYGYRLWIRNFDKLREALGVADDAKMLSAFEDIVKNCDRKHYQKEITNYLQKNASIKVNKSVINEILGKTHEVEAIFDCLVRARLNP